MAIANAQHSTRTITIPLLPVRVLRSNLKSSTMTLTTTVDLPTHSSLPSTTDFMPPNNKSHAIEQTLHDTAWLAGSQTRSRTV